jgi:hypothetical protein
VHQKCHDVKINESVRANAEGRGASLQDVDALDAFKNAIERGYLRETGNVRR